MVRPVLVLISEEGPLVTCASGVLEGVFEGTLGPWPICPAVQPGPVESTDSSPSGFEDWPSSALRRGAPVSVLLCFECCLLSGRVGVSGPELSDMSVRHSAV